MRPADVIGEVVKTYMSERKQESNEGRYIVTDLTLLKEKLTCKFVEGTPLGPSSRNGP